MTELLIIVQLLFTIVIGLYFINALKIQKSNKVVVNKECEKEMESLIKLRSIELTLPLTEKSRPADFKEIIGQEKGIKALEAAICGPNPQHVIIYGPAGVGKTAAARLVLEKAKKKEISPFGADSKIIEIDATTIRFDDRGIADPLIGSVHDPIYQGAGALGIAGIPQPKQGAVTKAHGGILFIDEIGELHPIEMNKLLKVLEDRKVFLDSSYFNREDSNIPEYIREVFVNGFPADFRLIGATTRSPEDIPDALRSRCVEVFFKGLDSDEVETIARNAIAKIEMNIEEEAIKLVGEYCSNGREAVNLIQLSGGIAINEERNTIKIQDINWVIENGRYTKRLYKRILDKPQIGYVNGIGVYGSDLGMLLEIEASAIRTTSKGKLVITGVVEQEEIKNRTGNIVRKSSVRCSIENVLTVIEKKYSIDISKYNIHINFPGGMPVDGPSAGISIAVALLSAIKEIPVNNKVAMTGEISLSGKVKPVGGISVKIKAAKKAGAEIVIIPIDNYDEVHSQLDGVRVIAISSLDEAIEIAFINNNKEDVDILTAKSL
ncbi:MAG: ATP-dependent protease LonB [Clostridiaceae bacterium]